MPLLFVPKSEASGSLDNNIQSPHFSHHPGRPFPINRLDLDLLNFLPQSFVFFLSLSLCRSSSAAAAVANLLVLANSGRCINLI